MSHKPNKSMFRGLYIPTPGLLSLRVIEPEKSTISPIAKSRCGSDAETVAFESLFQPQPNQQANPPLALTEPVAKEGNAFSSAQNSFQTALILQDHSNHPAQKRIGCRCNMSKCLRLHCRCFKDLEYCARNCKCTGCFNQLQ